MIDEIIVEIAFRDGRRALAVGPGDFAPILFGVAGRGLAVHRLHPEFVADSRVIVKVQRRRHASTAQAGFESDNSSEFIGPFDGQLHR